VTSRIHREHIAGEGPARWVAVTHGIFGSGANWRSIARLLVEKRPDWGAILVDLRGHGRSEDGEPPHDVASCAADVLAAVSDEVAAGRRVQAVCGHSFGGKVMLAVRAGWPDEELRQTWVLDATPSPRPDAIRDPTNTVIGVLDLLASLPKTWHRRADFVRAASGTDGGAALANWLGMSLVPDGDGVRLRLDVDQMRELLTDYYARDLWAAVEDPRLPGDVRFVVAGRSTSVDAGDRARAAAAPRTTVDMIDAGHWLHVDAPAEVVALLAAGLPG
jgi:pimeloyl-ACP methyl ester carboxylesterase